MQSLYVKLTENLRVTLSLYDTVFKTFRACAFLKNFHEIRPPPPE